MAEAHSTCVVCGTQFSYERKLAGRQRRFCSLTCKDARKSEQTNRYRQPSRYELKCQRCGNGFVSKRPDAKVCSLRCREAARADRRRANGPRKAKPILSRTCECVLCGVTFHPRRAENSTACSRKCGLQWSAFKALMRVTGGRVRVVRLIRKKKVKAVPQPKPVPMVSVSCCVCGASFTRERRRSFSRMCSDACKDENKRKLREARRTCPKRRAEKKMRKALARGASSGEKVNPIAVFERDSWRCGICGRKTLPSKRGSYHDRAPELDHIVALANGGEHTWRNLQCACRSCNLKKGASDYGQVPLFAD